jgi:hypothetical protein
MTVKTTTKYDMFTLMEENRDVDLNHPKTKKLSRLMVEYGWLDSYPLMAIKKGGKLIVIDGQHRLQIAREFGIPVKYVVESEVPDVAELNSTAKTWTVEDYVRRFQKRGLPDYVQLVEFYESNPIPITMCAAILANTSTFGNVSVKIKEGRYEIKRMALANRVADCYRQLIEVDSRLKKNASIRALWACFQVDYFEPDRLVSGAARKAGSIRNMGDWKGFLHMFEELYNFGRKHVNPLAFDAEQAMAARRPKGLRAE